jgi:hypothetical protein
MREPRKVPITPIWRRYLDFRGKPQKERLALARHLVEHPEELANDFADSVTHFSSYVNLEDPFYPPSRPSNVYGEQIRRTHDLVLRLEDQKRIVPSDGGGRTFDEEFDLTVRAVPANRLTFDYVDRELLVQRTTSPASWEDGGRNVGGLRLDVLLADAEDRTPIIGEVKLPGDMDSFFAFVQALACAAHLATSSQYARMRRHLTRGAFPKLVSSPRLDVWVISVPPLGHQPGRRPKGRYVPELQGAVDTLAPRLLAQEGIRDRIRRVAWLEMSLNRTGAIAAEVRWAWEAR